MTTLDIVLVVVAVLLVVFAWKVEQYVFKNGRSIGVGMLAGGLAAALVAFVVLRHILHRFLIRHAHGHVRWLVHGWVPALLVVALAAVPGMWVWIFDRNRYHKD